MGWTYKNGPGCNENRIGEFVNESFIGDKDWKCEIKLKITGVGRHYHKHNKMNHSTGFTFDFRWGPYCSSF
jgi:hypothetical protein